MKIIKENGDLEGMCLNGRRFTTRLISIYFIYFFFYNFKYINRSVCKLATPPKGVPITVLPMTSNTLWPILDTHTTLWTRYRCNLIILWRIHSQKIYSVEKEIRAAVVTALRLQVWLALLLTKSD